MNRSLYLAVRGGRRKKLREYGRKALRYAKTGAKVAGGAAAALALCTATGTCPGLSKRTGSGEMYSRLQTKVDDAIKRKLKEYGQEVGKGVVEGIDFDRLLEKGDHIFQKNLQTLIMVIDQSEDKVKDIIDKADSTKIARFAGRLAGKEKVLTKAEMVKEVKTNPSYYNMFFG
jgi:hypothetical protein